MQLIDVSSELIWLIKSSWIKRLNWQNYGESVAAVRGGVVGQFGRSEIVVASQQGWINHNLFLPWLSFDSVWFY